MKKEQMMAHVYKAYKKPPPVPKGLMHLLAANAKTHSGPQDPPVPADGAADGLLKLKHECTDDPYQDVDGPPLKRARASKKVGSSPKKAAKSPKKKKKEVAQL